MGWWWLSSSSPSSKNAQPDTLSTTQQPDIPQQPSISSQPEPKPSRQLTREEQADADLRDFLKSLESSITPPTSQPPSKPSSTTTTSTPTTTTFSTDSTTQQEPPSSIAPDSLYPDTMSCRSAFDYAFFCQSFGGQWVNVYRYGELRSCSEHWENFWLCMKARGIKDDATSKEMIRNHYRKKAVKYKTGPSSEDVWEVRMEPLKGAFQGDFEKMEREMRIAEEQQQQQMQGQQRQHEMPEKEVSPK